MQDRVGLSFPCRWSWACLLTVVVKRLGHGPILTDFVDLEERWKGSEQGELSYREGLNPSRTYWKN